MFVVRRLAANHPRIDWVRPPMHLTLAAAVVGGVGVVTAEAIAASGATSSALGYLVGGPTGWVRVARVAAEALALALCLGGFRLVAPATVFAAGALAFAGHASAVRLMTGGIFNDTIHVLSAGIWAGGILALATLRPPSGWGGNAAHALLDRFGRVAPIAFAFTALTGVIGATEGLRGFADLWSTQYGVVLSLKVAGVVAMAAVSALVWGRRLTFGRGEAVLTLLVLAATALLAAFPIPPGAA